MHSPTESRRIQNILASISDCFYALDAQWRFIYLNPQAEAYFGLGREEIFGRELLEIFPSAKNSIFIREFERVAQNGGKSNFVAQSVITKKWVDFTVYAQPKDEGLPESGGGLAVFFRDITAEVEAREAIERASKQVEESRRQLEEITLAADIAIWKWNASRDEMQYLFNLDEVFGFPVPQHDTSRAVAARLHPDDVAQLDARIAAVISGEHHEYNQLFRVGKTPDANPFDPEAWRWILQRGTRTVDANGDVIITGFMSDVTHSKRLESALDASQSTLQKVAREAGVAIWVWEPERDFIHEKFLLDESFGFRVDDFQTFAPYVHPDDMAPTLDLISRVEKGQSGECVYRIRLREGADPAEPTHWKWFAVKMTPGTAPSGAPMIYGFSIDATKSHVAQENLRRSELRFRSLVSASVTAVWRATADGLILPEAINSNTYIDLSPTEFARWGWLDAVHPDDRERARQSWQHCVETGEEYDIQYRLRGPRGYRWMRARGVPVVDNGAISEWIGTLDDLHDEKLAAELREQLLHQEREARLVAEASNRAKDEFLAVVSHELRTPLNAILGWSHLLQHEELSPETARNGLEVIERNARAQAHIVEDIFDVARVVTGKLSVEKRPLNLRAVVEEALESIRATAQQKQISLDSTLCEAPVSGDATRLRQVLWNLLSNALKFTPAGGTICVKMAREDGLIAVSVQDSGQGIAPEFLPHVFDRFRQADSSSTRSHGGLGLGLALVRSLVEAHNGRVEALSAGAGQGATFVIRLPLLRDENFVASAHETASETPKPLAGKRILVVEDAADTLELVALMLSREGAQITPVSSAQTARIALETAPFDLVLTDLAMPEQSGYDLLGHIRRRAAQTPVVAMSAFASAAQSQRASEEGFAAFIAKPIEKTQLLATILGVL